MVCCCYRLAAGLLLASVSCFALAADKSPDQTIKSLETRIVELNGRGQYAEAVPLAKQVVALKITFAQHAAEVSPEARDALLEQITRSTREAEQTIVKVMPWLDDAERGEAIELLVALRAPL